MLLPTLNSKLPGEWGRGVGGGGWGHAVLGPQGKLTVEYKAGFGEGWRKSFWPLMDGLITVSMCQVYGLFRPTRHELNVRYSGSRSIVLMRGLKA